MQLRKLESKDAPLMLEWMHDSDVVAKMQTDFQSKTLEDCLTFIKRVNEEKSSVHLAIVNDEDEYMGTVSLKNIVCGSAEFAIAVRKCAMGVGYSKYGMKTILELGLKELSLNSIYWCVSPENIRAVRFYDKNGYKRIKVRGDLLEMILQNGTYSEKQINEYIWYEER